MQGQTLLDVQRGIDAIHSFTRHIVVSADDDGQVRLVTDSGALAVVAEIEEMTDTIRQVIIHDSGIGPVMSSRVLKFLKCGS
jgi:hypothetical protein